MTIKGAIFSYYPTLCPQVSDQYQWKQKRHILRGIAVPLLGKGLMTCSPSFKVLIDVCKFWALIIVYGLKFLVPEISRHWEFKYCRHLRRNNAIAWLHRNLDFCNQRFLSNSAHKLALYVFITFASFNKSEIMEVPPGTCFIYILRNTAKQDLF